jgi:hypothetical protein
MRLTRYLPLVLLMAGSTSAVAQWPPTKLENLRVLPDTITPSRLIGLMGGFTRALGVRCTYCHVGEEGQPLSSYDFPSDEKLTKRKARVMLDMVMHINDQHLSGLEERTTPSLQVQCVTCHSGRTTPRELEDVLLIAYEAGGLDSALATYRDLRERYYGRAAYDFGSVPLTVFADAIRSRSLSDMVAVLTLNLELNPSSVFAQRQYSRYFLSLTFRDQGVEAGVARYRELLEKYGRPAIPEFNLNSLGYFLLGSGKHAEAIAVFSLAVEAFPESGNAYDSLAEAYATAGDGPRAIVNYERSLELNPENENARTKLRELRQRP